jgi:hypothetical protein
MKRADIDQRFASFPFDYYSDLAVQEVVRQAFIIFSNGHYNVVQPASKIARRLIEDYKHALEATDLKACWGEAWRLLIWVLFLGAHMSAGQRERPWFVMTLARAGKRLGPGRGWLQVRALLVRFYYVDRVFQDEFCRIWDEAQLLESLLPEAP